jgi:hypothetical protein
MIVERPLGGPMRLLRSDPTSTTASLLADRLDRMPALGDAVQSVPDVLVSTPLGDRILEGVGATPLLVTPAGVDLTGDVLLASSWRVLGVAASGLSAVVFRAPDGSLLALPPVAGNQRALASRAGNLVLDGAVLLHWSPGRGAVTVQTTGPVRWVLSGHGA